MKAFVKFLHLGSTHSYAKVQRPIYHYTLHYLKPLNCSFAIFNDDDNNNNNNNNNYNNNNNKVNELYSLFLKFSALGLFQDIRNNFTAK